MAQPDIPLKPLPVPEAYKLAAGIRLLPPLSHRGHGPGMIVVVPDDAPGPLKLDDGVPSPSMKYAEEGYTVVELRQSAIEQDSGLQIALRSLREHEKCLPKDVVGLIVYGADLWRKIQTSQELGSITATAIYTTASTPPDSETTTIPTIQHLAGPASWKLQRDTSTSQYDYPKINTDLFALPGDPQFDYATEAVSHSRNLAFLKKHMNGPYFDLEAVWDEHQYYEFVHRSVDHTMSTMVQEPYVNHIPTMTGGIGRENLTNFYRDHFIFSNPSDIESQLISRTVGVDRVVDECIMTLTHDCEIDYLLPGIPPTGQKLDIPYTAIVNIRGDRLYHEHITWDQATVLKQIGLIPEYVSFPYPTPGDDGEDAEKKFEVRLPVLGAEMAAKIRDKNCVPSNELLKGEVVREV